ncbi:hypothetical protein M9H77_08424 [Catharanthus roseus]|uniref:Uncharacterized protein n=1 Tax=Catharanthus roseus TaxID=4058 RepID=A0ACC0BY09_CATRO|nr:hypothetical protein M9H77_08424 [Catharanthus roseus]
MKSEMHDLTTMLDEITTGPISKVRKRCHLMKEILCPVLPEDPCALLTYPPEHAVTKGRRKTKSTKRDKSYWEHVRKIGKSRRSSGRSSLSFVVNPCTPVTFPYIDTFPKFVYEFIHSWKNVVGDGNCGFRVVANFMFGDENHWPEVRRRMTFDLQLHLNVYAQLFRTLECVYRYIQRTQWFDGPAPEEHWLEIPNQLEEIHQLYIAQK